MPCDNQSSDVDNKLTICNAITPSEPRDYLTGLLCRSRTIETLSQKTQCASPYAPLAVYHIDIAQFKRINETYGYQTGDTILREVAQRLASITDESFPLIRLSGDEFLLIHTRIHDYFLATEFADKLIAQLTLTPILISENDTLLLCIAIGVLLVFNDGITPEMILKQVDFATVKAKAQGKNSYSFYSTEIHETHTHKNNLISKLSSAIDRQEIKVFYQPQKSIIDGKTIGYEALIRWNHSENGMIKPEYFIPLLEQNHLIEQYGFWVLKTACEQYQEWLRQNLIHEGNHICVNLSPYQLKQPNFIALFEKLLNEISFPPEQLSIELTESVLLDNNLHTSIALKAIKDMGVNIALDDFGSGYASFSYLKKFPIDTIKIDRQFIQQLSTNKIDRAITESIINLAKAIGIYVIAEGVDSLQSLNILKTLQCDGYQGYLISEPKPANMLDFNDQKYQHS